MNILSWLGRTLSLKTGKFWAAWFGGSTFAGQPANPDTAMQLSAVWRAVVLRASTMATLPHRVYRRLPDGEMERVEGSDIDFVLRTRPNEDQTPVEFWQGIYGCAALVGNGYARKLFRGSGASRVLIGLETLSPTRTAPMRENGRLRYEYIDERGVKKIYSPDEIFHLKGFSFGSDAGMSPIRFGADTISTARAANKVAGEFFRNGMVKTGFVETDQIFDPDDRTRLQEIVDGYLGDGKGLMILEGGMKFTPIEMNPEDAQLLVSRKFEIEEIARWFGMPPILLGHSADGQTEWGSGIEGLIRAWYTLGLRAEIKAAESAMETRLLTPDQRARFAIRIDIDALLQGDSETQGNFFAQMVQNGILTRNEVRALLNRRRVEGGDDLTAQVNLAPLTNLGQESGQVQARSALRNWLMMDSED